MEKERRKPDLALDKHLRALRGTPFARCAPCTGSGGKVGEDGMMFCSHCPPQGKWVTAEEVKCCDGRKPASKHQQHVVFIEAKLKAPQAGAVPSSA